MSTAYSAASVIIPNGAGVKAGTLQAWRPDVNLLQDIDVSRPATTNVASYIDNTGTRVFVGANVARWDWSEGLSCPSLLVEPQRTNLFDQDLAGAGIVTKTVTVVSGTEYSVSVEGSGSMTLSGAGTGTVTEGSHITFTASTTSLTLTYTAPLTYVQVEAGSYPSSIIYTSGSIATRNADAISKTVGASLIGQSEGTLYVEASVFIKNASNAFIIFSDQTEDNIVGFNLDTSGIDLRGLMIVNSVPQVNTRVGSLSANTFTKIAIKYTNNFEMYQDGLNILSAASVNSFPPSTLNTFDFGLINSSGNVFAQFYGRIRALAWWKSGFTNAELQNLTTP